MSRSYQFFSKRIDALSAHEIKEWADFCTEIHESSYSLYQNFSWSDFFSHVIPPHGIKLYTLRDEHLNIVVGSIGYDYPLWRQWSWLYLQRGPLWKKGHMKEVDIFLNALKNELKDVVWIRFDPPYVETEETLLYSKKWKDAHKEYHPKRTLILDLTLTNEEILQQMHPKGRYNIKLAQKKDVQIMGWNYLHEKFEPIDWFANTAIENDPLEIFSKLMLETGERDGFSVHDKNFYKKMLQSLSGKSCILLSQKDGKWVGGGLFVYSDTTMVYYYGASLHEYRQYMAPYLLQWRAIEYAKTLGKETYDFLGIASEDKNDPLIGVTQFKKKFGGTVREYMGTFEHIMHPMFFKLLLLAKKLRRFFKRVR